jgi:phosphatidylserine/phosphatidylglycerophosphate/cardiolipin synthase-like enzyme
VGFDSLVPEWIMAVANGPVASGALPATQIVPVVSPDTSLSSLVTLLRSAKRTLDIEQLNFNADWNQVTNGSPILAEVIAAARRGVQVRVLLNDDASSFGGDPETSHNAMTAQELNRSARQFGVKLEGRIANLKAMGVDYIHNKGVLIDGAYTLVSSINWNENSITRNRESGVVLTGPEINSHYETLFSSDWEASAK